MENFAVYDMMLSISVPMTLSVLRRVCISNLQVSESLLDEIRNFAFDLGFVHFNFLNYLFFMIFFFQTSSSSIYSPFAKNLELMMITILSIRDEYQSDRIRHFFEDDEGFVMKLKLAISMGMTIVLFFHCYHCFSLHFICFFIELHEPPS